MKTKKSLAPFFSDIQDHFQPYVNLYAGRGCWEHAVKHWHENGRGSTLALDIGQDPRDLLWPAQDRIVICTCTDYHSMFKFFLLDFLLV